MLGTVSVSALDIPSPGISRNEGVGMGVDVTVGTTGRSRSRGGDRMCAEFHFGRGGDDRCTRDKWWVP